MSCGDGGVVPRKYARAVSHPTRFVHSANRIGASMGRDGKVLRELGSHAS